MSDTETVSSASHETGLRDNAELYGQAGLATYVAAKIFGSPSLPRDTPDWLKAAVESQANFAQRLPGADAMTIGGASGGPIDERTVEERQHDQDAEETDYLFARLEQVEREQERQRQHEAQWVSETHTYAGATLTGAEWRDMINWFGKAENVAGWEDAMMAETGESREEVRRTGGKMKRFYDLMGKDAKGTLTKDEKAEFTTLQKDEKVKRGIEVQQEIQGLRSNRGHDQTADSDVRISGSQQNSVADRSDLYADEAAPTTGLAAVEPLSPTRKGDCQDFRVWAGMMGTRSSRYVTTQRTDDTERSARMLR